MDDEIKKLEEYASLSEREKIQVNIENFRLELNRNFIRYEYLEQKVNALLCASGAILGVFVTIIFLKIFG